MAITDTVMVTNRRIKLSVVSVLMLSTCSTFAGDLQVTPRLSVDEIYSDNIELRPRARNDNFVTLLTPGLNLQYLADGASVDLDYAITQTWYSDNHDLEDTYNTLLANGSIDLLPNGLSLQASASITHVSRSDARSSFADFVSANTVEYSSYKVGLAYNIISSSFSVDSAINLVLDEAEDNVGERDGYNASFASESGHNSRLLFWDVNSNYFDYEESSREGRFYMADMKIGYITNSKINPFLRFYDEDFSGNLDVSEIQGTSSIGAGLRWRAADHLTIDVSYNIVDEKNDSQGEAGDETDDYFSGSIGWKPSARTDLFAKYYKRFFGDAYQLAYRHRTKRLTTTISYNEVIDAFDRAEYVPTDIQELWCLTGESVELDNCLLSPDESVDLSQYTFVDTVSQLELQKSNAFSLIKTFSFTTELSLSRTTYQLNLKTDKRENLEFGDYDTYDSAGFTITRLTSRSSELSFKFSYYENSLNENDLLSSAQNDYYRRYNIGWTKTLNRTLNVTYSVLHLNKSSNLSVNYEENRVYLQLVKEF
ncbi:TIGR03016 family PEP-CTERM system-associated outer membrane protein [Thalassotalea fonticola]|uniref:TIGR03016 family PEP-CTERM system-associated outer membrane protein n=1 Tax=Thalassotalea fonticola TaxID=3065649 RepID=A0ABZ0GLN8_9GAMM|nr:TIGR03016 family PEP-CTERM system-associated outer membrane protein [Colwelliaceae bacterium S1-1]